MSYFNGRSFAMLHGELDQLDHYIAAILILFLVMCLVNTVHVKFPWYPENG